MTTTVGQGTAGIGTGTYPTSFKYWIANTTSGGEPVTHTTASASNPRIDTVVVYVNESQTFATSPVNQPGGWTAIAVAGTPNASPSAPSAGTIQAAVGPGNPYIVLYDVLVGTNVTNLTTGNITDRRAWATLGAANLATNAITLGYVEITSAFTITTSQTTPQQATGLSLTVTIPPGGRRIRITANTASLSPAGGVAIMTIWDGVVNSGTQIAQFNSSGNSGGHCIAIKTLPAGSKTYNVGLHNSGLNNSTIGAAATGPAILHVEAI